MRQRHGCFIAWLGFLTIGIAILALISLIFSLSHPSVWVPLLLNLIALVCLFAIWNWNFWGFIGYCVICAIYFPIQLALGDSLYDSLGPLIGAGILFAVMQIGKPMDAWSQLE